MLNTAAGAHALDPQWPQLAHSLGAACTELLLQVVLPGSTTHVLAGVRLAVGVLWIVLVPTAFRAGLGYLILDARDRLAYPDLMALILVIGTLGWALDGAALQLRAMGPAPRSLAVLPGRLACRWTRHSHPKRRHPSPQSRGSSQIPSPSGLARNHAYRQH